MRAFCVLPEVETEHESAISARFHKNQATNVRKYFLTTPRAGIVTCYDMPRAKERGIGIGLRFGRTAQRTDTKQKSYSKQTAQKLFHDMYTSFVWKPHTFYSYENEKGYTHK